MTLLSFDASTKKTGYSVFVDGKFKEAYLIDKSKIDDADERIHEMSIMLLKAMDYYSPSLIIIEDTYCGNNPKTQKMLNRLQGVVYCWCIQHNADFNLVMPTAWRKHIPDFPKSAKRDEAKKYSIEYVKNKYNVDKGDDVADAICIGEAGTVMFGG